MGHVCKRHEVFVPTNESCRWCDPSEVQLKTGSSFVALEKMKWPLIPIPKVEGLTEKTLLLKDSVENPRIVKCHCGQWEFDRLEWPSNVVMESPDSRHTPGRCLFVDEVVGWYGEPPGALALKYAEKLQEMEKRYQSSRYRMCRCGEIVFDLRCIPPGSGDKFKLETFTKYIHHTPDACIQMLKENP